MDPNYTQHSDDTVTPKKSQRRDESIHKCVQELSIGPNGSSITTGLSTLGLMKISKEKLEDDVVDAISMIVPIGEDVMALSKAMALHDEQLASVEHTVAEEQIKLEHFKSVLEQINMQIIAINTMMVGMNIEIRHLDQRLDKLTKQVQSNWMYRLGTRLERSWMAAKSFFSFK